MRTRWGVVVGVAAILATLTGCQIDRVGAGAPVASYGPITDQGKAAFRDIAGLEAHYVAEVVNKGDFKLLKSTAEKEKWSEVFGKARQAVLDLEAKHTNGTTIEQIAFDKIVEQAGEPYRQSDMIRKITADPEGYRNKLRNLVQATLPIHQQLDDMLRRKDERIRQIERVKLRQTLEGTEEAVIATQLYDEEMKSGKPDYSTVGQCRRAIIIQYESLREIRERLMQRQVARASQ